MRRHPVLASVLAVALLSCGARSEISSAPSSPDAGGKVAASNEAGLDVVTESGAPAPVVLATGPLLAGIAVDATNVYWAEHGDGKIMKCAVGGCGGAPSVVASNLGGAFGVVVDSTNVYWTNNGDDEVVMPHRRCALGPTLVAPAPGLEWPYSVVVDSTSVYWSEAGSVVKCAIGGCGGSPTVLASSLDPHPLGTPS